MHAYAEPVGRVSRPDIEKGACRRALTMFSFISPTIRWFFRDTERLEIKPFSTWQYHKLYAARLLTFLLILVNQEQF